MLTKNKTILIIMFGFLASLFGCSENKNADLVLIEQNQEPYYQKGLELIEPLINLQEGRATIDSKAKDSLAKGIKYLDAVTTINPNNFAAYWLKGKAYQALKQHESAYIEFDKSFEIEKENPDVARELMIEFVHLGKGKEAVSVALHALSFDSLDVGLMGNLALAYLIDGDTNLANKTIKNAIKADPNNEINLRLSQIINDVISGKRTRPTKYDEIFR